jgi:LPS export ABC transporter protein LptC
MNFKKTPIAFIASIMVLVFFCAASLSSCKNSKSDIDKLFAKKLGVDTVLKLESYMSQNGKMKAKLLSNIMVRYQYSANSEPKMEFPDSIYVEFYNDTLGVETKVTANYAEYMETQQKIYLRDSVKIVNLKKGDTIYCMDMIWDQNKQTFTSEKAMRWISPSQNIRGTGFSAKQDLSQFNIKKVAGPVYTDGFNPE